jgi:hypothetical protein
MRVNDTANHLKPARKTAAPDGIAMGNIPKGAAKGCDSGAVSAQNVGCERSPNNLGQVGQYQNQCGGEKNKSRLTYFRLFEHG